MNRIKVSTYAKRVGLSPQAVRSYFHAGKIPGIQLDTGTILLDDPDSILKKEKGAALYSRVSSSQNKDNLLRQQQRLRDYSSAKGYQISYDVTEIGSGLNDSRSKLLNLLDKDWDILIVEHKDRLTRFGFTYLQKVAELKGAKIEVINEVENKDDLMQDFVSFCARLYGQRKTETIIKDLT